jgi:hypothetical protein
MKPFSCIVTSVAPVASIEVGGAIGSDAFDEGEQLTTAEIIRHALKMRLGRRRIGRTSLDRLEGEGNRHDVIDTRDSILDGQLMSPRVGEHFLRNPFNVGIGHRRPAR